MLPLIKPLARRIGFIVAINTLLIGLGTLGYMLIEGWSLLDSLYMTVITIGSVGYSEVEDLSSGGRLFTIVFIIVGVGSLATSFTLLVESILKAELQGALRMIRMQQKLERLTGHVIVCGYGRVGRNAAVMVQQENRRPIVIIENIPEKVERLQEEGELVIHGDATNDDVLRQAGIERAWGLLVATGSDSVNLFVVLSARTLNNKLTIVARSSSGENEAKMLRAGANRVVSPYDIGGKRMAHSLLRPHLTEFLDVLTGESGVELWLEEISVGPDSSLRNRSMAELDLRRKTGVTLLAIIRPGLADGVLTPTAETTIQEKDDLIVIGTRRQLDMLEQYVG